MNLLNRYKTCFKMIGFFTLIASLFALTGCEDAALINSKGNIGVQQRDLIYTAVGLMLIVVIPAIFLSVFFAWKYRASNTKNEYKPDWEHSNKIEFVVWMIPLIIIVILGTITWKTAHSLHPYKPIEHEKTPLIVEVVSLDWKWLFIYPEQGVASINELAIPVDRPVEFRLTSETVMNSFFVPQLGGQIYVMAGMQTKLNLIADEPGIFKGISASYSGHGFSGMKFNTIAKPENEFNAWVETVRATGKPLDTMEAYDEIAKVKDNSPVLYFNNVKTDLFRAIVTRISGDMFGGAHGAHGANASSHESHLTDEHNTHVADESNTSHTTAH
ncbi:ubiquinol oxidase subunit II [Thorsellia anophelis]|uniref:Ubiquinol oxidase subunit 2 n=1 Tax=Thorsellia anophelis DSM 18579 TaxID=1123402 RepID=A0A1I0DE14_9GAMM|nr:ubiquinol oxidase subunit II [Thorsellia anophelis]SET30598.1 cytochrome o ubiquinol oxidase subunit 2 [Thorsellia anophelis DSM 18579]